MIEAYERGDVAERAAPCTTGCCRCSPASSVPRAPSWSRPASTLQGLPAGPVRSPLVDATAAEIAQLRADCAAGRAALVTRQMAS